MSRPDRAAEGEPVAGKQESPLRQLQGMDASFVALETKNSPMHIGSLLIYNPATALGGFVRFKDILAFYENPLQLSKIVRQRLVRVPFDLDYPYWIEDPGFDLEYHLRHVATGEPARKRPTKVKPGTKPAASRSTAKPASKRAAAKRTSRP
jgi:hypothetical protein